MYQTLFLGVCLFVGVVLSRPQQAAQPQPYQGTSSGQTQQNYQGSSSSAASSGSNQAYQTNQLRQNPQGNNSQVSILNQTSEVGPDGSYRFSYGTSDGVNVEQHGYLKKGNGTNLNARNLQDGETSEDSGDILVIEGTVSYTAPDGQVINLKYIADENGYQPTGDHIPKSPTEGLARSNPLEQNNQQFAQNPNNYPQPAQNNFQAAQNY